MFSKGPKGGNKQRCVSSLPKPRPRVVAAKQAGLVAPGSGGASSSSGARTPPAPQLSVDAPETARATASGGGRKGGGGRQAGASSSSWGRLVPLSSSSRKRQFQAQGVERRREKKRFQLRDAPPALGSWDPPALPPSPQGRARQQRRAREGATGEGAAAGRGRARGRARSADRRLAARLYALPQPLPAPVLSRPAAPNSKSLADASFPSARTHPSRLPAPQQIRVLALPPCAL